MCFQYFVRNIFAMVFCPSTTLRQKLFECLWKRWPPDVKGEVGDFYRKQIAATYITKKAVLKNELKEDAKWICTTADGWTSRRRAFIGITVHWLNQNLKRRSACLAVRRVVGTCDYDVIAKLLESVYEEFDILDKVIATITDNGSNFVKAFRLYGSKSKHQMITPTLTTVPAPAMTVRASTSCVSKSNRLVFNINKSQFCIDICDWLIANLIGSRRCWYFGCAWRGKFWIWRNRRRLRWYRWWPCGWRPRGGRK